MQHANTTPCIAYFGRSFLKLCTLLFSVVSMVTSFNSFSPLLIKEQTLTSLYPPSLVYTEQPAPPDYLYSVQFNSPYQFDHPSNSLTAHIDPVNPADHVLSDFASLCVPIRAPSLLATFSLGN
jgi:hypothetical protein